MFSCLSCLSTLRSFSATWISQSSFLMFSSRMAALSPACCFQSCRALPPVTPRVGGGLIFFLRLHSFFLAITEARTSLSSSSFSWSWRRVLNHLRRITHFQGGEGRVLECPGVDGHDLHALPLNPQTGQEHRLSDRLTSFPGGRDDPSQSALAGQPP